MATTDRRRDERRSAATLGIPTLALALAVTVITRYETDLPPSAVERIARCRSCGRSALKPVEAESPPSERAPGRISGG
ncbi:hypothetical protein [Candidatus Solirubrobacter pratensis]|uniref:hypothetical protein n=1 Tax=Candidatus Solirubrobacter pratensis TaxID=1298857 RepID=UPI0003FDDAA3|nr:hypothetical protein [Candidatus Solirubrobacter pratensis]